jgi:hypothetical protein
VHGGEESLVLELVRVAAAAGGVVGPPVASHSPSWPRHRYSRIYQPNPALTFSLCLQLWVGGAEVG